VAKTSEKEEIAASVIETEERLTRQVGKGLAGLRNKKRIETERKGWKSNLCQGKDRNEN
jgi:hypothetical protein